MQGKSIWSAPTSSDVVARRAGGRKRYNAVRHLLAELRRTEINRLLLEDPDVHVFRRGIQSRIAERLKVHRSTISRDFQALGLRDDETNRR